MQNLLIFLQLLVFDFIMYILLSKIFIKKKVCTFNVQSHSAVVTSNKGIINVWTFNVQAVLLFSSNKEINKVCTFNIQTYCAVASRNKEIIKVYVQINFAVLSKCY